MRKDAALSKLLTIFIVAVMALCGMYMPWVGDTHEAYAKERGQKNRQACDHCNDVVSNRAPQGYTSVVGNNVFSGGNSYSKDDGVELDKDPTDFAKPLPYGNVYVDASKLNWNDPNGFIIDIQDTDRFAWVTVDESLVDKEGNKSTTDPMGDRGGPKPTDPSAPVVKKPLTGSTRGICYVGPLQSYLTNITDKEKTGGKSNEITPPPGKPYLYRITYLDAVTLPNGTKGNLVLTMNRVEIETSVTVDSTHPFTPSGAAYSYTNALIKVQGENQLGNDTGYNFKDADGREVNQRTSDITGGHKIRNATGNILDLDIEIQDTEGNPVEGTISYAAHDMDFESVQNVWGRPLGDDFSESLMIVSGSQSYALVPDYSKLVDGEKVFYKDDENAITRGTGWPPVGPKKDQLDRVLDIQKVGSGSHANGIRFASPFLASYRDADGDFSDVIFNGSGEVTSFQGDTLGSNTRIILNKNGGNPITDSAKQQIYSMLDEDDRPASWRNVTAELAWEKLGPYSWKTYRNDDDKSFDSGFAVLIDAKKTQLRWTGSRAMGANVNTTLFDPTLYTYVQQTHGTGGGIYLESYSLTDNCKPIPMEGVVTMARDTDATFTAVPEDGYRVKTIRVGGVGLSDPITYDVNKLKFIDNIYEDPENGVTIEKNSDGTYDITVANIDKPRHVHADFTADYYFYKVWKKPKSSSRKIPKKLELTATPFVYEMTSVTVNGVKYTISDEGTSYTANGVTHHMTATSTVKLGEGDNAKLYTLVGHDLVDSDGKKYPIKSEVKKGNSKKFTISSTGSDVSNGFVKVSKDSKGNTVWKVKYPEDGRKATSGTWPMLPIETYDGDEHNYNHIQRNYWFVTETVPPGWNESYDNTEALTPGVVTAKDGEGTFWKEQATIYHDPASELIASKDDNDHAFMSPLSTAVKHNGITYTGWGGEILNEIPDPASKPTKPQDEVEGKKVTGTGDNASLPMAVAALIAAALGAALMIKRRRRYYN